MKKHLALILTLVVALAWTGCDSSDPDPLNPTVAPIEVVTGEDEAVTIDVLASVTNPGTSALTVVSATGASNGTAVVQDNAVVYTPNAGFAGTDNFTVTVETADGGRGTGTVTVEVIQRIVGTWVSEGSNVAPGLAANPAFPTARIDATFRSNGTYTVLATNTDGVVVTFEGDFQTAASANGTIRSIVLGQNVPTTVTSRGIYEINLETGVMRYEVVQTEPEIQGFTPPTPEAGFGSTAFGGTPLGNTWIQTFVRVQS